MKRMVIRQAALGIVTLTVVSMLVFFATQALPGDTARAILGREGADPARLSFLRSELGLDRPVPERYLSWLGDLLSGDLGRSFANGFPVTDLLAGRVLNSFFLMFTSALVGTPLALLLGIITAVRRDRVGDHAFSLVSLTLAALPEFVIGVSLVFLLSTGVFHLFPAVSLLDPTQPVWTRPSILVLPTLTLALATLPHVARMTRGSMIEVLNSEYVEMARLKGIPEWRVIVYHGFPNAIGPTVQVIALQLAWLAGGVVVVEYIFRYPGIGSALVDAVATRDVPVIQALTLLIAAMYVIVNLIADIVTLTVTPKARTSLG